MFYLPKASIINIFVIMDKKIVHSIRTFNRLFVRTTGLLNRHIVDSGYSLTEAHILNLVKEIGSTTATQINCVLRLDEGYLSRIISKLVKLKLIKKVNSTEDKRVYILELTATGLEAYQKIDDKSSIAVIEQFSSLDEEKQLELVKNMERIQEIIQNR